MRIALVLHCVVAAALMAQATTQPNPNPPSSKPEVNIYANNIERSGTRTVYRGDVQIRMEGALILADSAVFDSETGEIQPEGHVRILRSAARLELKVGDKLQYTVGFPNPI